MIMITTIRERDAEKVYREFFEKEFVTQRLGTKGKWFGAGARLLKLKMLHPGRKRP